MIIEIKINQAKKAKHVNWIHFFSDQRLHAGPGFRFEHGSQVFRIYVIKVFLIRFVNITQLIQILIDSLRGNTLQGYSVIK